VQRGPSEKVVVLLGRRMSADLQQISPEQSALFWQDFGQVALHRPSQQILPAALLQSMDWVQATGHALELAVGLRQRPVTLRFGSTARTEVQQISPAAVSHSTESAQALGHSEAGKQMLGL